VRETLSLCLNRPAGIGQYREIEANRGGEGNEESRSRHLQKDRRDCDANGQQLRVQAQAENPWGGVVFSNREGEARELGASGSRRKGALSGDAGEL